MLHHTTLYNNADFQLPVSYKNNETIVINFSSIRYTLEQKIQRQQSETQRLVSDQDDISA